MDLNFDLEFTSHEIDHIAKHIGPFSAGFFRGKGSLVEKFAAGLYQQMCKSPLPGYDGTLLYPACSKDKWDPEGAYNSSPWYRIKELIDANSSGFPAEMRGVAAKVSLYAGHYSKLTLGNHSNPNYKRILAEGFESYGQRIRRHMSAPDCRSESFRLYQALLLLTEGISILADRMKDYLASLHFDDAEKETNRRNLVEAYSVVPMLPAESFAQAVIATNLLFYLDNGDNLGRIDHYLNPYYRDGFENGSVSREQARSLITALWDSVERLDGWSACIGGSDEDGNDLTNELTIICLETAKGRRRPNLALKIHDATPERVWDAALECISGGSGIPALYGEGNILQGLRNNGVSISGEDVSSLAFGGCTETLIDGCSAIGTNDYLLNTLKLLEQYLYDELDHCADFDRFYSGYLAVVRHEVELVSQIVNEQQRNNAMYNPALIRTLTTDDCIDKGETFFQHGARYTWSLITIAALPNTADSLIAIKRVVFDEKKATAAEFCKALRADYIGFDGLLDYIKRLPKFGNDIDDVDQFAKELSHMIALEFRKYTPFRGGKFLSFCNTYWVFDELGQVVGATPDGRRAFTPVAESITAVAGRDTKGPTALVSSAVKIDQLNAPGTMVFNIRFTRDVIQNHKRLIHALIETYFSLGGNQLQINVVDQKMLEDAMAHPENHSGLIVRVAGYSEYFTRLSLDIQKSILERVAHDTGNAC